MLTKRKKLFNFLFNFSAKKSIKMPSAVVVLSPGAEEMEFVGSVDVLRRAGVKFALNRIIFQVILKLFYLYQLRCYLVAI